MSLIGKIDGVDRKDPESDRTGEVTFYVGNAIVLKPIIQKDGVLPMPLPQNARRLYLTINDPDSNEDLLEKRGIVTARIDNGGGFLVDIWQS